MRNTLLLGVFGALFVIGLSSMTGEPPYNAQQCNADCELFVELGFFDGQGECRHACNTCNAVLLDNGAGNAATFANCQCNLIVSVGPGLDALGFRNHGGCIQFFKDLFNNGGL